MQPLPAGRLRWQQLGSRTTLVLPGPFSWRLLVGPVFFVVVVLTPNPWGDMLRSMASPTGDWGPLGWLFALVFGLSLLAALGSVLWQLLSREVLTISQGTVEIRREALGWAFFRRSFGVKEVTALTVRDQPAAASVLPERLGFGGGTCLFETSGEQVPFGRALDPAEARATLRELGQLRLLPAPLLATALPAR